MSLSFQLFVMELNPMRKSISLIVPVISLSDWPTIPQLYINGEFIGGCDIMTTMYQEGDLVKLLKDLKLVDPNQP